MDIEKKMSHEEYLASMTPKQLEAYNEFIDYMVMLYYKYGHILNDNNEQ